MKGFFKITISKKKLKNFFIFSFLLLPLLIISYFSSNVFAWVGPTKYAPEEGVAMANSCEYAFGALSCSNGCLIHECSIVAVGGECGGGKVAYHDGNGGGFIAHSTDNSTGVEWGCAGQIVGTPSQSFGTGLANTNAIVAFHNDTANFGGNDYYTFGGDYSTIGCDRDNDGTVAAKVCSDLTTGGYNDWFLPSLDELFLLFGSKGVVEGYETASYWSSSEHFSTVNLAKLQSFSNGSAGDYYKDAQRRVRCIRTF